MNEHATRQISTAAPDVSLGTADAQPQVTTPVSAEREFYLRVWFTDKEWNRLAFLRWSYQNGRLNEWAEV